MKRHIEIPQKVKILFLCTKNSCRSQIAEGWARHLKSEVLEPSSAGIEVYRLDPYAVKVMAEAGVDISSQYSKHVNDLDNDIFDCVVTVCDSAHERCPVFPALTKVFHVGFEDPPRLAEGAESGEEIMTHYRRVRDEIMGFVKTLPEALFR